MQTVIDNKKQFSITFIFRGSRVEKFHLKRAKNITRAKYNEICPRSINAMASLFSIVEVSCAGRGSQCAALKKLAITIY